MATKLPSDVYSKRFAFRIATMIDARLIWYKHYYRWADQWIVELDNPPDWLLEITTIRYSPDAVAAVKRFVSSDPFESIDVESCADEHVACLFLRYHIGATSWATFLYDAGSYTDAAGGRHCSEYFYELLSELEDKEYAHDIEARQRAEVESEFSMAIGIIRPLYTMFMEYFREYVKNEA